MNIAELVGMAVGATVIVGFVWTVEKRYRTNEDARKCMRERKESESAIFKVLRRMEKRMALGNLVMRDLVKTTDNVANNVIEQYEHDLGISLGNRDFGIPSDK